MAVLLTAPIVRAQDAATVTVRGVAWDSLRGAPLGAAFIGIAGSARATTSDSRGRFRFDSVAPGTYVFTLQHDVLDSIGLTGRSIRTTIGAGSGTVTVAVPSFATLWRSACGSEPPPKDTGFVYGSVRDANDGPASNAIVGVRWMDFSYTKKTGFDERNRVGEVRADSSGRYALCGVPTNVALQLRVASDSASSGRVELMPLTLRIARRDFRLAPAPEDPAAARGTITGTLTAEGGQPLAGAIIATAGVPEVRSDDDGRFTLRDVPAGTRQIEVRAIGASPTTAIVDVVARDTTPVTLEMRRVQTLSEIRVTAPTFRQIMIRNIEERRIAGLGYFRDSTTIGRQAVMAAAFDGVAGIRVLRDRLGTGFRVFSTHSCGGELAVWIDRIHLDARELGMLRPSDIAAVEVYPGNLTLPPEFSSQSRASPTCGAVLVWTKRFLRS